MVSLGKTIVGVYLRSEFEIIEEKILLPFSTRVYASKKVPTGFDSIMQIPIN
jgi:hypothetical protein